MKFISLSDGISVKKSEILMVERLPLGGCRVTTESTSTESIFPYETILALLENDAIEESFASRGTPAQQSGSLQFWRG